MSRYGIPDYKRNINNTWQSEKLLGRGINKKCIATGCDRTNEIPNTIKKGLCHKHYNRWIKFKDYNIKSKKEYLTRLLKKD